MASLDELRREAAGCTNCHLYKNATQTVFGEGSQGSRLMLVGEQEIDVVGPEVVACLGATAAQALLGRSFRVTKERGTFRDLMLGSRTPLVTATIHPSAILRADDEDREREYAAFVDDLRKVAE